MTKTTDVVVVIEGDETPRLPIEDTREQKLKIRKTWRVPGSSGTSEHGGVVP